MITRRTILSGLASLLAAPVIICTPGLLMPVKPEVLLPDDGAAPILIGGRWEDFIVVSAEWASGTVNVRAQRTAREIGDAVVEEGTFRIAAVHGIEPGDIVRIYR